MDACLAGRGAWPRDPSGTAAVHARPLKRPLQRPIPLLLDGHPNSSILQVRAASGAQLRWHRDAFSPRGMAEPVNAAVVARRAGNEPIVPPESRRV